MKTVHVQASTSYDILIGNGLLSRLGKFLLDVFGKPCKIAIISDSNVFPIYEKSVADNLNQTGFETVSYCFPAGEASKSAATYLEIVNFLAQRHITRTDAVLALGGGVVGDLTGFAAATYLRGIRYVQIPTSLLAMVDSSVGGKTAIDLPFGKNLVGAFYQPRLVVCDLDVLNTLPEAVFRDGCAEVIKYSVLYDAALFDHLQKHGLDFDRLAVISRCVELKRNVVAEDEFDNGARQKLNLGHTIGHGIEAQSNFTISHGQAVAIGMAIVSKAGCPGIYEKLLDVLKKFQLPTTTTLSAKQLYDSALSDKKRSGNTVNLIVPKKIGDCAIVPTEIKKLESFIEEGL